jgi:4-hydroxy-tetrahydrodipicolinate synthase
MPACEFPDLLAPILRTWAAGDLQQAGEAFARLLPHILFGLQPGIAWAVHKEILVMRGIIEGATVRSPAVPLDDRTRAAVRRILAQLELVSQEA